MLSPTLYEELTQEERQALGMAANQFALEDGLKPEYRQSESPIVATGPDGVPVELAVDPSHSVRSHQFYDEYAWLADGPLRFWIGKITATPRSRSRDNRTRHSAHGMVSLSHITSTHTTLFDHVGGDGNPMKITIHEAEDHHESDSLFTRSHRMHGPGLAEIHLATEQFARLIRGDNTQVACTITRRGLMSFQFDDNPHLDHDFDRDDIGARIQAVMASDIQQGEALAALISHGVNRKADREAVRAHVEQMLHDLTTTTQALRDTMKQAHRQAADASRKRHAHIINQEVAALPPSIRQRAQTLLQAEVRETSTAPERNGENSTN